jgi:selenocysteine lyase/cysteine desulfurase
MLGAAAAVDFLASLAVDAAASRRERLGRVMHVLHDRGEALLRQLWVGLHLIDGVTVYGPPPGTARTPTVSFHVQGHEAESVSRFLAPRGVYVSHGDFYAATVARRLGVAHEGLVRVGCSCYTTQDEIARLLEGVRALMQGTA